MKSKIVLVSPALAKSNNGNWHTAHRWAKFLSGHCDISITQDWNPGGETPAAMIALHARRSAPSIQAWAAQYPNKPLIVVLTGTDLYRDIQTNADAQLSLMLATQLVVLQDAGLAALPPELRTKTSVIYQSALRLKPGVKGTRHLNVVMVGHLRGEKDPLTYMKAAHLCAGHPINFDQIGDALDDVMANAAMSTAGQLAHYRWLGGLPRATTRQHIKRAHVLVNSSVMEGGAHVILEAVQSGTPVLASRISGNVGMLGADYPGYFDVGDALGLATQLKRCAIEPDFLAQLQRQCELRSDLFDPSLEKRHVLNLMKSVTKEHS